MFQNQVPPVVLVLLLLAVMAAPDGHGQDSAGKQSQNPIADLATLPIQNNWNFGIGPDERTQFVALVQPVIPLKINDDWNLITRPIMPFINAPIGASAVDHGLGDMQWQNFFVPVADRPSNWTWGVGPSFVLPTASDETLGLQRWGAGVSAVAVYTEGPVVGGALLNQNYIEGGVSKPFLVQPFFNYNFDKGILDKFFFAASGEFQADWEKGEDDRWSNVFGIGPGRIMNVMGQPMTIVTRFAPYLTAPDGGPNWQFRFQMNLLFPK
ncbi:hypothetical protein FYK55_17225 [Roseiconus nitratireducens]|uniref:Neuromedin U n=1 Tax=Roseiconus nitratireducens TaxID=2605748 RepID=A0A5M6D1D8_9BACT|nr:hypothetical protein [Roseiconus nitratireducens]KAA5541318.1 hypothetical protein FYK55_17225 [Roseiconus nitratireducens]